LARVSSEDIARVAQVSRATVSYVLNNRPGRRISDQTRQRILDTARSLGYVPNPAALALRSGQSKIVLLREYTKIPAAGHEIIPLGSTGGLLRDAVAREVRSWGMTLVSCGVGFPLAEALGHLTPSLVLAPGGLSNEDRAALGQASIPWYGSLPDGRAALDLLTKSLAGVQAGHLAELGHHRVGYLNTSVEEIRDIAEPREREFLNACERRGVDSTHRMSLGELNENTVRACRDTLLRWRDDGVTAVACFNDLFAGIVIRSARQLGWQVPGDLAVIGVDDEAMSWLLDPPLTTVRLRMADFGSYLAACGRAVLDGRSEPQFPGDLTPLVARSTT